MLIKHLYSSQRLEAGEGGFNPSLDAIEDGIEITRSEHVLDLEPGERKLECACYKSSVESVVLEAGEEEFSFS